MKLSAPVGELKGVGEAVGSQLANLGIKSLTDLINNFPRRYDDYSQVMSVGELKPGPVTLQAKIGSVKGRYVRRGLHITEAIASDSSGSVKLAWFNQPYRAAGIKAGKDYFISGDFGLRRSHFNILNPSCELVSDFPINTARIIPIYKEAKGVKSYTIRKLIREAINSIKELPEHLPTWLVREQQLMPFATAVKEIHFPSSAETLAKARRRLGFEEVFELTLAALLNKYELYAEKSLAIPFKEGLAKDFVSHLPFKLTNAQRRAVWKIYQDMAKTQPMNRLLEGDVGSGKTVVAAMAALMAMAPRNSDLNAAQGSSEERVKSRNATLSEHRSVTDAVMRQEAGGAVGSAGRQAKPVRDSGGFQVAFMAPTEILARQHAETLHKLLEPLGYADKISLLIGGLKPAAKKVVQTKIGNGEAKLLIGTHALISEKVGMNKLGVIIVDEQHRFGVEQRKKLQAKAGHMPHVLHMTATPIPRSLALTLYGELDVSILDEMPPGRQSINTKIVTPAINSRKQLNSEIDKQIEAGRQVFIVGPLISDSEFSKGLSVEAIYERLSKKEFKHRKVALLHGRMKPADKESIMQDFLDKKYDILVSTTVIEVGVDVPNASVMVVEGAERFGLAQLHQLRGRVGRSGHQSHCYLVLSDAKAPSQRLRALETTTDGFKLAEIDLELRGPGAIYGTMQHGALDLRVAKLTDMKLIAAARNAAEEFISKKENLKKYSHLHDRVSRLRAITNLN